MRKWMEWAALATLVTWWQVQAGIARCGTIDGGVLLVPLVALAVLLVRGVTRDMREVFGETSSQRRMTDA